VAYAGSSQDGALLPPRPDSQSGQCLLSTRREPSLTVRGALPDSPISEPLLFNVSAAIRRGSTVSTNEGLVVVQPVIPIRFARVLSEAGNAGVPAPLVLAQAAGAHSATLPVTNALCEIPFYGIDVRGQSIVFVGHPPVGGDEAFDLVYELDPLHDLVGASGERRRILEIRKFSPVEGD
jgi:hypothetical protein